MNCAIKNDVLGRTPDTNTSEDYLPPQGRPLSPNIIINHPKMDSGDDSVIIGLKKSGGFPSSCDDLTSSASSRKSLYVAASHTYPPRLKIPRSDSKASHRRVSPTPLALSPYSPTSALSLRSVSTRSIASETSTLFGPEKEQVVMERMRIIVDSFRNRNYINIVLDVILAFY